MISQLYLLLNLRVHTSYNRNKYTTILEAYSQKHISNITNLRSSNHRKTNLTLPSQHKFSYSVKTEKLNSKWSSLYAINPHSQHEPLPSKL